MHTTGDLNKIRALVDYSINRHYLKLPEKKNKYLEFLAVCDSDKLNFKMDEYRIYSWCNEY